MKVNCYKCNKEIDRKPSHIARSKYCLCSDCRKYASTLKMIDKYTEQLQIDDMGKWLYEKYITERLSIRQIMKLLDTKANNGISSMLNYYDIPVRHGSEAVETQWENNDERREQQRSNCNHLHTKESRDKLREVMQTDEYRNKSSKAKLGEKNPMYNPDLDRVNNNSRSISGNKLWRKEIMDKYGHKCDICSSKDRLQTHHLYNWSEYPEKRFDINNGVCLCEDCHIRFHGKYGQRHNTPEQYEEFKNNQ